MSKRQSNADKGNQGKIKCARIKCARTASATKGGKGSGQPAVLVLVDDLAGGTKHLLVTPPLTTAAIRTQLAAATGAAARHINLTPAQALLLQLTPPAQQSQQDDTATSRKMMNCSHYVWNIAVLQRLAKTNTSAFFVIKDTDEQQMAREANIWFQEDIDRVKKKIQAICGEDSVVRLLHALTPAPGVAINVGWHKIQAVCKRMATKASRTQEKQPEYWLQVLQRAAKAYYELCRSVDRKYVVLTATVEPRNAAVIPGPGQGYSELEDDVKLYQIRPLPWSAEWWWRTRTYDSRLPKPNLPNLVTDLVGNITNFVRRRVDEVPSVLDVEVEGPSAQLQWCASPAETASLSGIIASSNSAVATSMRKARAINLYNFFSADPDDRAYYPLNYDALTQKQKQSLHRQLDMLLTIPHWCEAAERTWYGEAQNALINAYYGL